METKVCKICGKEKPIEEFHKNQWGYTSLCKECTSKKMSEGQMSSRLYREHLQGGEKQKRTRISKQMRRIAELEMQLEECKQHRLDDFTPRELLAHLKKLGYKWEKLVFIKVEEVDWNKI